MQFIDESKEYKKYIPLITNIDWYLKQPGTHQTITVACILFAHNL